MKNHAWLAVVDIKGIEKDWYGIADTFSSVVNEDSRSPRILSFSSFEYPEQHKIYPPDLFRFVLSEDLCTAAATSDFGHVCWFDYQDLQKWSKARLHELLENDDTAPQLFSFGKSRGFDCEESAILDALRSGDWPVTPSPMIQSASFLKCMADAAAFAIQHTHANVMWGVDDGLPIHYPVALSLPVSEPLVEKESDWMPPCELAEIIALDDRLKWLKAWDSDGRLSPKIIKATIKPSKRNWNVIVRGLRDTPPEDGLAMSLWLGQIMEHWPDALREPDKDKEIIKSLVASSPLPDASLWRGKLNLDEKRSISSLKGLQRATGLTEISVWQTSINDLSPLKDLDGLEKLSFPQTEVEDLSPLSGMTSLREIYAWNSKVSDLTPLAGLTSLKVLNLARTPAGDLVPIAGLVSLRELSIGDNFNDLAPISGLLELEKLLIPKSSISDISALKFLVKLRELSLSQAEVSCIEVFANLVNLEELYFSRFSKIESFEALRGLRKLKKLTLNTINFEDLRILADLTELQVLFLGRSPISDLGPISALQSLEILHLTNTPVQSLAPLAELSNLKELYVPIDFDLSPLHRAQDDGLKIIRRKRRKYAK